MLVTIMKSDIELAIKDVLNLQEFVPNTHVNKVMSQLVECVIKTEDLNLEAIEPIMYSRVRNISAKAETEMEKFWAQLIIKSSDPNATLQTFPYRDNYRELTKRELFLTNKSGLTLTAKHKVLMIGSGPLPLSAYEMHHQSGASIDHVDPSQEAINLCQQLNTSLGIHGSYFEAYGQNVALHKTYDLILIAALAGETAGDKQKILENVLPYLSDEGRIVVRSARGSRRLLYPAIASKDLVNVQLLEEYHPTDYIINSVFVYGK